MRSLVLGAMVLAISACGAYSFPGGGSPSPDTGQVAGKVVAVPCAPVERANSPCPGRPVGGLEIDYVSGEKVAGRTVTGSDGTYSIRLDPGSYTVKFNNYMRVISGPTNLTVAAGSNIAANYVLDSGIRVPVPQQ